MNSLPPPDRRRFLRASASAMAGAWAGAGLLHDARAAAALSGENDHFFWRLGAPDGPYIDSQRGDRAFGFGDGKIFLSEDNGRTWPHAAAFPEAENITFSVLLENGNILFATRERLFLSTDKLASHREIVVKRPDGGDYRPHTPKDPNLPGWYFHSLDGVHTWNVDGREMLVWGNYCNVLGGPVPVNIYYSTDGGETVKLAYSFGQNPKFQEKDSPPESWLGNPDNSVIARHVHCVAYHPAERAFYACTGDIHRGHGNECHWLRGTHDAASDAWDWKVLISVNSNSRYKSGGINFVDGQLYWAADANGPALPNQKHDRGIFRCAPADLADRSKHTRLFDAEFEMANMLIEDGVIVAGHCAPASTFQTGIAWSPDLGRTWVEYDLADCGPRSPVRFQPKNGEGWFRMDLRKGWIERADVLFLKPKG
ncbi:MAG: exo-alpha-sialidase [Verrucomicrobiae bacterium]|nr:exo-alpha-sialidase [Verrucomicrobiae bacterium]